jgi:retron-type reverse transcriptase
MKTRKATGVDEITKEEYEKNLTENIDLLIDRMKKQAYKPQPVRRTYYTRCLTGKVRRKASTGINMCYFLRNTRW